MTENETQARIISQIAKDSAEGIKDYVDDHVDSLLNAGVIPAYGGLDFKGVLWVAIMLLADEQSEIVDAELKKSGD